MFCKRCGYEMPDDTQSCPNCGMLETHFNIYIEGVAKTLFLHQDVRKNFYLIVEKLTSSPIYGAEVHRDICCD